MTFSIPIQTKNPQNGAQGRSPGAVYAKATKRKRERQATRYAFLAALNRWRLEPPYTVTLTRVGAGTMDDDGLAAALKSVRDQVAAELDVDDGSDKIRFIYRQQRCKRGVYSVTVEIA